VQAYGANNHGITKYGYVKLNAVSVWQASWRGRYPNLRGVNVINVDQCDCSVRETRHFDTHVSSNASIELSNYLQQVNHGTIIVGVSADSASENLANALPTLRMMGADVRDVRLRGAFAFVTQKGFSAKTVLRKVLTEAQSEAYQPHFTVTITGSTGKSA